VVDEDAACLISVSSVFDLSFPSDESAVRRDETLADADDDHDKHVEMVLGEKEPLLIVP
jgi:hypothetical protein